MYPVKHYLSKFKSDIDVNCSFCAAQPETVPHLFWHCTHTKNLWRDYSRFVGDKLNIDFKMYFNYVILGVFENAERDNDKVFFINLFCWQNSIFTNVNSATRSRHF